MSRATWDVPRASPDFEYGPVTLYGAFFHKLLLSFEDPTSGSRNPNAQVRWFGLFPFRSPLLRESLLFSFPPGTEMFHFPGLATKPYLIQTPSTGHYPRWVFPFGNLRVKAYLPLSEAYRSLSRPSSPADAKASIMRPFALDQNYYKLAVHEYNLLILCLFITVKSISTLLL